MDIVVPRPWQVTYFLIGCPLIFAVLALLLRGKPAVHRILLVAAVSAACLLFHLLGPGPMRFSWNQQGIVDGTFREVQRIGWSEVRELRFIPNYRNSEFRPVARTNGSAYAGYFAGTFSLANGMSLRVFLVPESCDALFMTTGTGAYLYAPSSFDLFRRTAEGQVGNRPGQMRLNQ